MLARPLPYKIPAMVFTREYGENHERNAGTLRMRGSAKRALRVYSEAATSANRALEIYEAIGATVTSAAVMALANFGSILSEWTEQEEASATERAKLLDMACCWLDTALTVAKQVYGEDHPMSGGLHRALGKVRRAQGADEDAQRHLKRAEVCREKHLRETDAGAATEMDVAGRLLNEAGLYEEAQEYLQRALDIRQNILGDRSFGTSTSLLNSGILSQLRGFDVQARRFLERALDVREDICGQSHPATELVRENLRLLEG